MNDTREALAAYAHEAWSGWMEYLFGKGTFNDNGTWTIPQWAVERWQRQMNTPYADLPENEKESDRAEADKMLALLVPDDVCQALVQALADIREGVVSSEADEYEPVIAGWFGRLP